MYEVGLIDRDGDGAVGDNQNGFRSRSACRDELLIVSIWIQKAIAFQTEGPTTLPGGSSGLLHAIIA